MTPSLIHTQHISVSYNADSKVESEPTGGVSIALGYGVKLSGNRREDFENLIALATKALELFPTPAT